jgi:hypothetical protein
MFHRAKMFAAAALLSVTASVASAATVGFAATDRATADGFSNFAIALSGAVFSTGSVNSWETWIERIDGNLATGTMSLLVLDDVGGGNYDVVGIDTQTVGLGFNSFMSNIHVTSGNILAILMGTAKVSYDLIGANNVGSDPFSLNGAFGVLPGVGDTIALNAGVTNRQYSIQATVVPLPASGLLLLGALGGFAALRRRKTA